MKYCLIITMIILSILTASGASGTVITFNKSIDVPDRDFTVTYEGSTFSFTITDIGNYKIGDNIGISVSGGVNNMRLVVFTVDKLTPWFKTFYDSSGWVSATILGNKFDPNCPDVCDDGNGGYLMGPGIYALAIQNRDTSSYFIAKPFIVSVYDITVTPNRTEAKGGSIIRVIVNISKNGIPVNVGTNTVKVDLLQDSSNSDFSSIAAAAQITGRYEANIQIPSDASGNFLLNAGISTNRNIYQDYQETIGAASFNGNISIKMKGDFNGNGIVDIGDASMVAYMVIGKKEQDMNADFNKNGIVDIGDASKIAYYLVRKLNEL